MEFFRVLYKVLVALIGLPLTLAESGGFWYGIYMILGGQSRDKGVIVVICLIVALTVGTILGKFARGDYAERHLPCQIGV